MVSPVVAPLVDRIDGAEFQYYTDYLPSKAWSVFSVPDAAIERVKRLNGVRYAYVCGCPIHIVEDTGHQEGCGLA
jgi:hypothetical protein